MPVRAGGGGAGGDAAELEVQLAIRQEEMEALRARMESALARKDEEAALLRTMMKETRRVFSEAVAKAKARG